MGLTSITDTSRALAGLAGIHQRSNASLAVALVRSFLASDRCPPAFSAASAPTNDNTSTSGSLKSADTNSLPALPTGLVAPNPLPEPYVAALERTQWPGRCQLSPDPQDARIKWYLDGAHTVESLKCCGEWFAEEALARCARFPRLGARDSAQHELTSATPATNSQESAERVLIFNCTSGRSGLSLLGALTSSLSPPDASKPTTTTNNNKQQPQPFKHVIFCTNTTFASGSSKGGEHARPREILLKQNLKISILARLIPPPSVIPRRSRPSPSPSAPPVPCEDLTSNAVDAKDLETLATQRELAAAWEELAATTDVGAHKAQVHVLGSIEEAIDVVRNEAARENGSEVQALVTGSLHLVGGVMAVADLPL